MNENNIVADRLTRLAQLLELKGENPFKIRAYTVAVDVLEAMKEPVSSLVANGTLGEVKGFGDAIQKKIIEILETGTCPLLQKLEEEIPAGVVDMLRVKGLGPKKILVIWNEMGITSIGELHYACQENRLVNFKGFGQKTQDKILAGIEFLQANETKFHYATLLPVAKAFLKKMQAASGEGAKISMTGEIRRKVPVLDKAEFIAAEGHRSSILQSLSSDAAYDVAEKENTIEVTVKNTTMRLIVTFTPGDFTEELFRTTGSDSHTAKFPSQSGFSDEADLYKSAGVAYIEPELREDRGEVELAKAGKLPKLVQWEDIRGSLHNHTDWSDGINTLKEMALACKEHGWEYFGVSDHSKTAIYANGLKEDRILAQHEAIDKLNAELAPFRIFKGIESDILGDGSLDYADDVLRTFDFIVASVHSQMNMDEAKATARLIRAIENPYTTILGHPTGRILLVRNGYPIDHMKVIDACAANAVHIEINASPWRLDIDWTWIHYAMEKGVMISINPDAHQVRTLEDTFWGIEAARKGMLTPEMTLNTRSAAELEKIFRKKNPGR